MNNLQFPQIKNLQTLINIVQRVLYIGYARHIFSGFSGLVNPPLRLQQML